MVVVLEMEDSLQKVVMEFTLVTILRGMGVIRYLLKMDRQTIKPNSELQ